MPTGDSFACVEGSVVNIMVSGLFLQNSGLRLILSRKQDLGGKIKDDHPFERLEIHDVAPTHDEQR